MRGWRLQVSGIVAMLVLGSLAAQASTMVSMNDATVSDLRRFAAGYVYDGRRLRLRTSGDLSEASPPLRMHWELDIDEPVVDQTHTPRR